MRNRFHARIHMIFEDSLTQYAINLFVWLPCSSASSRSTNTQKSSKCARWLCAIINNGPFSIASWQTMRCPIGALELYIYLGGFLWAIDSCELLWMRYSTEWRKRIYSFIECDTRTSRPNGVHNGPLPILLQFNTNNIRHAGQPYPKPILLTWKAYAVTLVQFSIIEKGK